MCWLSESCNKIFPENSQTTSTAHFSSLYAKHRTGVLTLFLSGSPFTGNWRYQVSVWSMSWTNRALMAQKYTNFLFFHETKLRHNTRTTTRYYVIQLTTTLRELAYSLKVFSWVYWPNQPQILLISMEHEVTRCVTTPPWLGC